MDAIDWRLSRYGWWLWISFLIVLTITVAMDPTHRRIVTPTYRLATAHWWAHQDLYSPGIHGFEYLPQSAILFTPLTWLPLIAGEEIWRWVGVVLLAWGVWRLCRLVSPHDDLGLFLLVTVLTIPMTVDSAHIGQANLLLAALMSHAAVSLARRRWWAAAGILSVTLAVKPLGLDMLLLSAALYSPMRSRLSIGVTAALLLPFFFADSGYVLEQYRLAFVKMDVASHPGPGRWADLTSLVRAAGGQPSEALMLGVRLATAVGALALAWLAGRRSGEPRAAILVLAVAATYLMLCNPRTQENSYVMLGPAVALFTAWALLVERRPREATLLIALCAGLGFHRAFSADPNYWLQPLLALIFAGYLTYVTLANRLPGAPQTAVS